MTNVTTNNGGPAFPCEVGPASDGHTIQTGNMQWMQPGMTLRDYFAAKAMQIMWDAYDKGYCGLNNQDEPNVTTIAQGAYQMADAMLRARQSK